MIDEVRYDDAPPWPAGADGSGASLQLLDPGEDNNRIGNWAAVDMLANQVWQQVVVHGQVTGNPRVVLDDVKVHFYLNGAGATYVDRVYLCEGLDPETGPNLLSNGGFEEGLSGPWAVTGTHAGSARSGLEALAGDYSLELSASSPGDTGNSLNQHPSGLTHDKVYTLSYWYLPQFGSPDLTALMTKTEDTLCVMHGTAVEPVAGPYATPGAVNNVAMDLPPFPDLWINEVMPSNVNVVADNYGEYEPWVELYNAGSSSVDISGWYLSNNSGDLAKWAFPAGTAIDAGERLLIWADGQTDQTESGYLHAGFRLDAVSGMVVLSLHLRQTVVIDALDYAAVGEDFSFGSYPEGDPFSRQVFHHPTPGYANSAVSLPVAIKINEWMADNDGVIQDPSDGNCDDWFELYNAGEQGVNLAGYSLTDNLAWTNKFVIPWMHWLPAGGHMLVWADEDHDEANAPGQPLHVNFKLSADGEEIGLYAPDGTLVDSVVFGAQATDTSDGSYPDGGHLIYPMRPPTPGTTNRVLMIRGTSRELASGFTVHWLSEPGTAYRLEYIADLLQSNWTPMMVLTANAPETFVTDTNAVDAIRFYRIGEAE